MDAILSH